MCVCGSGHLVRVVAGRNTYITLEVAYQAQVVCYGDRIVAHVGIYSCMFSLSLCSAVTVFCDNFLSEKMYSVLLENIFTFISRLYMYSKLITLVRVLQIWSVLQCTCALKVRESYSTFTVILELAHSAFCVCTAIVMKCFNTPPQTT